MVSLRVMAPTGARHSKKHPTFYHNFFKNKWGWGLVKYGIAPLAVADSFHDMSN